MRMCRVGCYRSSEQTRVYVHLKGTVMGDSQGQVQGTVLSRES